MYCTYYLLQFVYLVESIKEKDNILLNILNQRKKIMYMVKILKYSSKQKTVNDNNFFFYILAKI